MVTTKDKIVILGADHNGVEIKSKIKDYLSQRGYYCIDVGSHNAQSKDDYVDFASTLGKIIEQGEANLGILICGTGVGMSMVANKFDGVRASLIHNIETAPKSREHNNANVLCLGAWVNPPEVNLEIVKAWFAGKFGEGRHVPRIEKFPRKERPHKVIFTNGIFDILHPGHIELLKFAKFLGDKLIVGINSDRATKILKGNDRPVNSQDDRRALLESLDYVDEVIIFDDVRTTDIVKKLKPDIVVKGDERTAEQIRQMDGIPPEIEIKVCPLLANFSTTAVIKKTQGKK